MVSEAIVATTVTFADKSDPATAPVTLSLAEANLVLADSPARIQEAVLDKGYHDNELLADGGARGVRTYIPERRQKSRRWTTKPASYEAAFRANHRRVCRRKGRQLNLWRSERCERTFAHVCETGGGRRSWVRGQTNVSKLHTLKCAAYNLGLLLRKVWGFWQAAQCENGGGGGLFCCFCPLGYGRHTGLPEHHSVRRRSVGWLWAAIGNGYGCYQHRTFVFASGFFGLF